MVSRDRAADGVTSAWMRRMICLGGAVAVLLYGAGPALAQKSGGVLRVYHRENPPSASILEEGHGKRLYVLDHLEYDAESLADEYFRDVKANVPIKLPLDYFPDDDTNVRPPNRWRAHGHLLLSNWINEMYQTTPYHLQEIGYDGR